MKWSKIVGRIPARQWLVTVAFVAATGLVVVSPVWAAQPSTATTGAAATFEGELLDLGVEWREAHACLIWDDISTAECFRSEAEMDSRIVQLNKVLDSGSSTTLSQCSGSVRLYDDTGYGGDVLYVRNRLVWINLGSYGFSNRTSSFKIGSCAAVFADYTHGDGSRYPTSGTEAWDVAPGMVSGWNDRISSIFIG